MSSAWAFAGIEVIVIPSMTGKLRYPCWYHIVGSDETVYSNSNDEDEAHLAEKSVIGLYRVAKQDCNKYSISSKFLYFGSLSFRVFKFSANPKTPTESHR